jgi:hypothetical protein
MRETYTVPPVDISPFRINVDVNIAWKKRDFLK